MSGERAGLSVVIINWNTNELLLRCLASLHEDPGSGDWQIIVIDNASEEDPSPIVTAGYRHVRVVRASENLGFAAGNNLAAREARGEYLLFLNADTELPAGTVGALAESLDARPDAGAVAPRLVGQDGQPQVSSGRFPGAWQYLLSALMVDEVLGRLPVVGPRWHPWRAAGSPVRADYLPGACLMVRRPAFEAAGGWPEAYFFYGEDAELAACMQRTVGASSWLVRSLQAVHVGGASVGAVPRWRAEAATRAALLFVARNRSGWALVCLRGAILAGTALRLLVCALGLPVGAVLGYGRALASRVRTYAAVMRAALTPRACLGETHPPDPDVE